MFAVEGICRLNGGKPKVLLEDEAEPIEQVIGLPVEAIMLLRGQLAMMGMGHDVVQYGKEQRPCEHEFLHHG